MDGPREVQARLRPAALVIVVGLHVAVVILVLGAILERFGREPASAAGLLFPITYLVGPLLLGVVGGAWLTFALLP